MIAHIPSGRPAAGLMQLLSALDGQIEGEHPVQALRQDESDDDEVAKEASWLIPPLG